MNKLIKGAVAGAAGIALLLGGAGTFAAWNSTTTVPGGQIVSGNLLVETASAAGVWTANGSNTPIDLANFKAVPGDTLTYTKNVRVTAAGDTLVATLGLGAASITPRTANNAADTALAGYLTRSARLSATGTGVAASGPDYVITAGANGVATDVTVIATITFPKDAAAGAENSAKLGAVDLNDLTVTLTQN